MAYTAGRRNVNVSQYLRNLNVQEPAVEETMITDDELAKDLALFTNTQFFDFETGQNTDYQPPPVKQAKNAQVDPVSVSEDVDSGDTIMAEFSQGLDFMTAGDFNFGDYTSTYASPTISTFTDNLGNLQPIQPSPQTAYPPTVPQHQPGYVPPAPRIRGEKRKAEAQVSSSRMLSFEEASRLAAEEDKRKRNTAASARFRIKKKQREQALEKSAKEMTDKVTALEGRISALETENKWLKSLVTEKHGGKDDILKKLLKEFSAQQPRRVVVAAPAASSSASAADEEDSRDSSSSTGSSNGSSAGSITASDDYSDHKNKSGKKKD
ncbi:hypothetical protein B0T22DRAFT_265386 [Podospora appendiculata]|uniref:BZIP domain-containing protein n=1 Tax=Podospora appendiculata TaxID=314037 RepID=A0AAE1C9B1_9PEZI|nr:hypothetical protein B0T22DRAFT_265386 [Podospora appendiculata]